MPLVCDLRMGPPWALRKPLQFNTIPERGRSESLGTPAPSQLEVILSNNVKAVWSLRENTHSPSSSVVTAGKITLAYSREGTALEGNPRSGLCAASLCAGAGREPGKAFSWRQGFGHKTHLERREELAGLGSWLRIQYCPLLFITGSAFMY